MESRSQNLIAHSFSNKHEFIYFNKGYQEKYFKMICNPILMENIVFGKLYFKKNKNKVTKDKDSQIKLKSYENNEESNKSESTGFTSLKMLDVDLSKEQVYFQIDHDLYNNNTSYHINPNIGSKFSLTYYSNQSNGLKGEENESKISNLVSNTIDTSSNANKSKDKNLDLLDEDNNYNINKANKNISKNKNRIIMNKNFKVTNYKVLGDKSTLKYFITETHIKNSNNDVNPTQSPSDSKSNITHDKSHYSNNNNVSKTSKIVAEKKNSNYINKIIQYELIYTVYKIESKKVLLKIELIFHPSIKIPPLFDKKLSLKISSKIENEIKRQTYEVTKNVEIALIKASRRSLMDALSDFNNINGCEVIYNRVGKETQKLDRVDDKFSLYYKAQSCEYHFVIKEYFETEDLNKPWVRSSYLFHSVPETLRFYLITRLKAITPELTLFEFEHQFDGHVDSELMNIFVKDKLRFIEFIKKRLEEAS